MGKRKKPQRFEWVADEAEGEAVERVERPNRSAAKKQRKRLQALAKSLGAMSRGARRRLGLDPELDDALDAYAATKATPNRRRTLLHVIAVMSDLEVDADALEDAL